MGKKQILFGMEKGLDLIIVCTCVCVFGCVFTQAVVWIKIASTLNEMPRYVLLKVVYFCFTIKLLLE